MDEKSQKELDFWQKKIQSEGGKLKNSWYVDLFTNHFKIASGFYTDKKILDIGCGPRGTLEWANMASERIGLDHYADYYAQLAINSHQMQYVSAKAHSIPFDDNYFDVVSAFNVLEYIHDISAVLTEIFRVLKPGGIFLLLSDVGLDFQQKKSITTTTFAQLVGSDWEIIDVDYYEKKDNGIYKCLSQAIRYDQADTTKRGFIASVLAYKPSLVTQLTSQPKVSIIMPVQHEVAYLWQAIESVFKQTYTSYEIIVVDSSSDSIIGQRLKPYQDRIVYLAADNANHVAHLNDAIGQCRGELITFLDTNNFWVSNEQLAKQVADFEADTSLGLLYGGWQVVKGEEQARLNVEPWQKNPQLNIATWLQQQTVNLNALMIRRQWLEKVGNFNQELKIGYDLDLVLRLSLVGCPANWLQQIISSDRSELTTVEDKSAILNQFFARADLPKDIKEMESKIRYTSLVKVAWEQYYQGKPQGAIAYLAQSLKFSPYLRVETICNWIEQFVNLSRVDNVEFDVDAFSDLEEWKGLVM
ncbi:glycosyl transferase family protein [Chondrocystis sp. NIES-4102]|nr:glycosyl transferase family protein [Chondrocystis sp. NIES-4102]